MAQYWGDYFDLHNQLLNYYFETNNQAFFLDNNCLIFEFNYYKINTRNYALSKFYSNRSLRCHRISREVKKF
jgi:hypothetical protein